ncbi:restriction endonuclease subunit S [Glutamicibacter protophormiae]|uniref:restriction endonuclease subunit S n=1 Tax=Glutamicibacter protophormiae TaxID=37930 RepID=UPI003A94407D
MRTVPLGDLVASAGKRAGAETGLPVYSVTKHLGFVPSLEYFKKQIFSRDVGNYRLVEPGDFAYATIHLDEGSVGIAPARGLISPMYTVFRADISLVDPAYLIRFLKSPQALSYYPRLGKGAVHRRKTISLAALGTLPVPLPPLIEQHRIAAILDHADAIRAKRRKILIKLDTLSDAIFMQMFGDGDFTAVRVDTLMPHMRNGLSPATSGTHESRVLTLSAVTRGAFDPTAVKPGLFAISPPQDKRVAAQDFMMCRGNGNLRLVGSGVYSEVDHPDIVFPDTVIAGRVDTSLVTLPFLEAAWRGRSVRSQIESVARTTNGTYKVNQKTLGSLTVPLPPLDIQHEFEERVSRIGCQRAMVQRALVFDEKLFTSLQSRAFSGGL